MTNEEKQAAQNCINIIQQQAAILNKMGADVSEIFENTRDVNRWVEIESAEGHEIFDIEPSISIHSGEAQ
jgi:hypothetical protein